MIWSHLNYSAPPDAEDSNNQICGSNGLDVGSDGSSGRHERNDMTMVDRNGMVERSGADHKESDADCKESNVDYSWRDVVGTGSDVRCNVRDVDRKERIVDRSGGLTSDVAHLTILLATLARKKFAQHFQTGRKLDFAPATVREKIDCDNAGEKGDESEISEEERIQQDSLHIKHGRLTNL